ncbi:unnamed protein product [Protopolystoma xenopodis]|uniref:Uncharacterized protein n=1 Tax=Protopolystoma xenopodis TaxID=117903 RepID=A0A3S5A2K5_9PLAT|nr:unnamed protein product [Protopolystoma xenopodis]
MSSRVRGVWPRLMGGSDEAETPCRSDNGGREKREKASLIRAIPPAIGQTPQTMRRSCGECLERERESDQCGRVEGSLRFGQDDKTTWPVDDKEEEEEEEKSDEQREYWKKVSKANVRECYQD